MRGGTLTGSQRAARTKEGVAGPHARIVRPVRVLDVALREWQRAERHRERHPTTLFTRAPAIRPRSPAPATTSGSSSGTAVTAPTTAANSSRGLERLVVPVLGDGHEREGLGACTEEAHWGTRSESLVMIAWESARSSIASMMRCEASTTSLPLVDRPRRARTVPDLLRRAGVVADRELDDGLDGSAAHRNHRGLSAALTPAH